MTGLSSIGAIVVLETQCKVDFQFLSAEVRGEESNMAERKAKAIRGASKAILHFKERKRLANEAKKQLRQPRRQRRRSNYS